MNEDRLYTFIVNAAITVGAESEAEAREKLKTATLEEDTSMGSCGVYIPPLQETTAELTEIYPEPDEE